MGGGLLLLVPLWLSHAPRAAPKSPSPVHPTEMEGGTNSGPLAFLVDQLERSVCELPVRLCSFPRDGESGTDLDHASEASWSPMLRGRSCYHNPYARSALTDVRAHEQLVDLAQSDSWWIAIWPEGHHGLELSGDEFLADHSAIH